MRLVVSDADVVPDLVDALNAADCIAARTGPKTVEVFAPWLLEGGDAEHAATELVFFVRAWASDHPGFRATLEAR